MTSPRRGTGKSRDLAQKGVGGSRGECASPVDLCPATLQTGAEHSFSRRSSGQQLAALRTAGVEVQAVVAVSLVIRSVRRGGIISWLFLISHNALPFFSIDAASLRACSEASSSFLRNSNKLGDLGQTWRARPFPGPSRLPNSAKHRRVRPRPPHTASSCGVSDRSACDIVLVRKERPNLRPPPRFTISRDTGRSDPASRDIPPAAPGQSQCHCQVSHSEQSNHECCSLFSGKRTVTKGEGSAAPTQGAKPR